MTVGQLISELECYGEDQEVYIGQQQSYGSDFVYNIGEVSSDYKVNGFYEDDDDEAIIITLGNQTGTMGYED